MHQLRPVRRTKALARLPTDLTGREKKIEFSHPLVLGRQGESRIFRSPRNHCFSAPTSMGIVECKASATLIEAQPHHSSCLTYRCAQRGGGGTAVASLIRSPRLSRSILSGCASGRQHRHLFLRRYGCPVRDFTSTGADIPFQLSVWRSWASASSAQA